MFGKKETPGERKPPKDKPASSRNGDSAAGYALLNCITGDLYPIGRDRVVIGSDPNCDLLLTGYGVLPRHCEIRRTKTGATVSRMASDATLYIDGNLEHAVEIPPQEQVISIQIGAHHYFLAGLGKEGMASLQKVNTNRWAYAEKLDSQPIVPIGPFRLRDILESPEIDKLNREKTVLFLQGTFVGFRLSQFLGETKKDVGDAFVGEFQCPRCWLRFDLPDMLYIAAHPDLHGDPILGTEEMKRFRPTRFVNGRPVDEKGSPCSETACPHCRGKLPHGYHDLPVYVFSIVGISSAGKSYYLALLIHHLKRFFFRHFKLSLIDADGGENQVLNEMIGQVTGASTPEEAYLQKTTIQGITYKNFRRFDRDVLLPQPFVYSALSQSKPDQKALLIFYDNAGEHFLPGQGEHDETTEHIAYCQTTFFLFDPVRHLELHKLLKNVDDPQVQRAWTHNRNTFVQDTVLGEMQRRMQVARNRSAAEKSDKPLAMIIGKYDLWQHLLPETELRTDFVIGGKLNLAAVEHNSGKVREFMLQHCPDIVGAAEAIAETVMYFPVSTFGSHAVETQRKGSDLAPDPAQLQPKFLEIPTAWALSLLMPSAIPSA